MQASSGIGNEVREARIVMRIAAHQTDPMSLIRQAGHGRAPHALLPDLVRVIENGHRSTTFFKLRQDADARIKAE